jgi:hypothetical protein
VNPDPRRREPAINRALRALNLPPLLSGDYDEDPEPMGRRDAISLIAVYVLVFGFGIVCAAMMHDHLGTLYFGHTQNFLALYPPLTPA